MNGTFIGLLELGKFYQDFLPIFLFFLRSIPIKIHCDLVLTILLYSFRIHFFIVLSNMLLPSHIILQ
jgi:hypothetical protein